MRDLASTRAPRRILWQNVSTVLSAAILIGAEVFGAAFAGGWAIANLIGLGTSGVYAFQIAFFVIGLAVMVAFVRNAMRHGGQLPPGAPQFTRALASLRTLRGMLATSLRRYEQCMNDPQALAALDFQTLITLTKVEASELAAQTVMHAMRACGLSGYRNDSEYSIGRHLRDVLSSPIMINNDRILANLATPVLMSPIAASLRD